MPFNRSHIFCFTTKGIFWLLLLGCLNLFLTVKLTGLPKINDAFPSQVEQHEVLVTNTTSLVNLSRVTHVLPGRFLFKHLNLSRGRLDQSRNFRIFDHVITGRQYESLSAEYDVTLVSQSTLNKLHWIAKVQTVNLFEYELALNWNHCFLRCLRPGVVPYPWHYLYLTLNLNTLPAF